MAAYILWYVLFFFRDYNRSRLGIVDSRTIRTNKVDSRTIPLAIVSIFPKKLPYLENHTIAIIRSISKLSIFLCKVTPEICSNYLSTNILYISLVIDTEKSGCLMNM